MLRLLLTSSRYFEMCRKMFFLLLCEHLPAYSHTPCVHSRILKNNQLVKLFVLCVRERKFVLGSKFTPREVSSVLQCYFWEEHSWTHERTCMHVYIQKHTRTRRPYTMHVRKNRLIVVAHHVNLKYHSADIAFFVCVTALIRTRLHVHVGSTLTHLNAACI